MRLVFREIDLHPFGSQRRLYSTFDQNFDLKIRRDQAKIPYERRVNESVDDDRSLSWAIISYEPSTESRTLV